MVSNIKKYKYYCDVEYLEETYKIEKEIIVKYRISIGKSFEIAEWNKLLQENNYYYYDRISKDKLRKLLTVKELKDFLFNNGASISLIEELINKYLSYNYLNDEYYTKIYINTRGVKEGPKMLTKKLKDKGIDEDLINRYLNNYDENKIVCEKVEFLIKKYQNLNKQQLRIKIKQALINKGYSLDLVNQIVEQYLANLDIDETKLIYKDYQKLMKKYQTKKTGNELQKTIKTKLYQKGYSLENINKIINDNESV